MDTDSFILEIETDDVYEDILRDGELKNWFDFSKYPQNELCPSCKKDFTNRCKECSRSKLYTNKYENHLYKMKDEANGKIITDFAGCRSKMYVTSLEEYETIMKKAKGIKGSIVKNLTHADYKEAIENKTKLLRIQNIIQSRNHELFTLEQKKIALSGEDDKCHILDDNINTLAYGHYKLKNRK